MKTKLILFLSALIISTSSISQTVRKFTDTGSIPEQFDNLIKNSNRYKDYKVVKTNWLYKLKANVTDTLKSSEQELVTTYNTISSQKKSIDSLKLAINTSNKTIENLSNQKESISLFGAQIQKDLFKIILFSLIAILTLLLGVFIFKFKQSNTVTVQTKQNYKELESEFDSHRKKALEREQKVRRQLQDELNKQKKDS